MTVRDIELLRTTLRSLDATMTQGDWKPVASAVPQGKEEEQTYSIASNKTFVCRSGRVVDWNTMSADLWGIRHESDAIGIARLRTLLPTMVEALDLLNDLAKNANREGKRNDANRTH